MSEKYCSNCGSELESGDAFCSSCGQRVSDRSEYDTHSTDRSTYGSTQDTTFAAITHIVALLTWVIGPIIVLVATDDEFVERNARKALNWQIMFAVYMIASFVLAFVFIGFLFLFVLPILDLAFCILAAIKASEGEAWTYPFTPDLV